MIYVGFWMRFAAFFIDSIIVMVIISIVFGTVLTGVDLSQPEATAVGGAVQIVFTVLVAAAVILFWRYRGATPGKMVISARVVDADTGGPPSTGRLIARYFGYFISTLPFGLGFLWIAWDARKQGWHDKLAGTVVVRVRGDSGT